MSRPRPSPSTRQSGRLQEPCSRDPDGRLHLLLHLNHGDEHADGGPAQDRGRAGRDAVVLVGAGAARPCLALSTLLFGKLSDLYGRRALLLLSMAVYLAGVVLCAFSRSFEFLIAGLFIIGLGQGAVSPLCFSILGDLFGPAERSRWAGLLNIPGGMMALFGPTLSGYLVDNISWRYIFALVVPFILISTVLVVAGLKKADRHAAHKVDVLGSLVLTVATSTMLVGLSWGGARYAWGSAPVLGLLAASVLLWGAFLRVEAGAAEPMLDPQVLTNRTFVIAALSAFLSFFGLTAITAYLPLVHPGSPGCKCDAQRADHYAFQRPDGLHGRPGRAATQPHETLPMDVRRRVWHPDGCPVRTGRVRPGHAVRLGLRGDDGCRPRPGDDPNAQHAGRAVRAPPPASRRGHGGYLLLRDAWPHDLTGLAGFGDEFGLRRGFGGQPSWGSDPARRCRLPGVHQRSASSCCRSRP